MNTLEPINGKKIENPSWNFNETHSIMSFGERSLIFVANITADQPAIIHWCNVAVSDDGPSEDDITRLMVIPMPQSAILALIVGETTIRETYTQYPIHLIDITGFDENKFIIKDAWNQIDSEFINQYLPETNMTFTSLSE